MPEKPQHSSGVIHYDPVVTDDPELTRLHTLVDELLSEMDSRLKTHDFRMVPGGGHTNLIFDIAVPQDIKLTKQDIQSRLEEALRTRRARSTTPSSPLTPSLSIRNPASIFPMGNNLDFPGKFQIFILHFPQKSL